MSTPFPTKAFTSGHYIVEKTFLTENSLFEDRTALIKVIRKNFVTKLENNIPPSNKTEKAKINFPTPNGGAFQQKIEVWRRNWEQKEKSVITLT